MEQLKTTVEELFKFDRQLIGSGYDNSLEYLKHLLPLDVLEFPSGQVFGTWKSPDEWVVRDAWVKFNGEKIIDYKKEPLSLLVYSLPFQGIVTKDELLKHLYHSEDMPTATPYNFKFYDRDWGFCVPQTFIKTKMTEGDPYELVTDADGNQEIKNTYKESWIDNLQEGEYEVFIDCDHKPGVMKIGVHTIKGTSDREILLLAHLDHPQQANDNLSGVACLLDIWMKYAKKEMPEHTIKLIFCPETIGSMAYAETQDLSKVDFVAAVDICGNDNNILFQKSWNDEDRINRVAHCALQMAGNEYRKGKFRTSIGSDETPFNDPLINIPGVLLTRWPYDEYHTNQDTPDKLRYDKIQETADLLIKMIEIYEKDYVPKREFRGPLMRSRYSLQSPHKRVNLVWDYLIYSMDGKKYLSELCADSEMSFDYVYQEMEKVVKDGKITKNARNESVANDILDEQVRSTNARQRKVKSTPRKK